MSADRKLPGNTRTFSFGFPEELWLRGDHLLCVSISTIYENYRRFYYRDIESIVVTPTRARLLYNLLFCAIPLFGALLILLDVPARAVLIPVLAPWLLLTLINTALGPTCKTVLRTRINTRVLGSLRRRRTAERALALLNARILAAQSDEPAPADAPSPAPEPAAADPADAEPEVAAEPAERPPQAQAAPPPAAPAAPPPLPTAEPLTLRWHLLPAALGVLQGVCAINAALYPNIGLAAALMVLMLITSFACVPAVIVQRRHAFPAGLCQATWCLTVFQYFTAYPLLIAGSVLLNALSQHGAKTFSLSSSYADALTRHDGFRVAYVVFAALTFSLVIWQALTMRSAQRP